MTRVLGTIDVLHHSDHLISISLIWILGFSCPSLLSGGRRTNNHRYIIDINGWDVIPAYRQLNQFPDLALWFTITHRVSFPFLCHQWQGLYPAFFASAGSLFRSYSKCGRGESACLPVRRSAWSRGKTPPSGRYTTPLTKGIVVGMNLHLKYLNKQN